MALKGNLRDFNLSQLFNLINLARKTGSLSIQATGQQAQIWFREGKLVFASLGAQDGHLAQVLYRAGKLSHEQTRTILSRTRTTNDKRLGMMLIEAGYVTQDDILRSVLKHTQDVVFRVFTWSDGTFRFEPNVPPPEDRIAVPISLENIIIEGSRRVKEWQQLQDELPNLDMSLRFTDQPRARLRNISLSVEEWRVVSFINPRNSIRQIAKATNLSDFQIRRIVYGMLQAGLVELVSPEGAARMRPMSPTVPSAPETPLRRPPPVKRSVIERLIARIKRL